MSNAEKIAGWLLTAELDRKIKIYKGSGRDALAAELAAYLENGRPNSAFSNVKSAKAASHEVRRGALDWLWRYGETTPSDIAHALDRPLGVVSYHVRMLRDYGVVAESRVEPVRGALQHFYKLTESGEALCWELFGSRPQA